MERRRRDQPIHRSPLRFIRRMRVSRSHPNVAMTEYRSERKRVRSCVRHARRCGMSQIVKMKIHESCILHRSLELPSYIVHASLFILRTRKHVLACLWQSFEKCLSRGIQRDRTRTARLALPHVHDATIEIYVEPFQIEDFSAPHSCVDCHDNYVLDPILTFQSFEESLFLTVSQIEVWSASALRNRGLLSIKRR